MCMGLNFSLQLCVVCSEAKNHHVDAFLFRSYELPPRVSSCYGGTSAGPIWEAARASAAAPGYFTEVKVNDRVLMVSF